MIFTDLMLANCKTELGVKRFKHDKEENIILKLDTAHNLATIYLNEKQAGDLLKRLEYILKEYKS